MLDLSRFDKLAPPPASPAVTSTTSALNDASAARLDALLLLIEKNSKSEDLDGLPDAKRLLARRREAKKRNLSPYSYELGNAKATLVIVCELDSCSPTFEQMSAIRKALSKALSEKPASLGIATAKNMAHTNPECLGLAIEGALIAAYQLPTYSKDPKHDRLTRIRVFASKTRMGKQAAARAAANNLARWLGALPPNKLDATSYRSLAAALAKQNGWQYRFYSISELKKMGAGAFAAIAAGNATADAGIVRLSYKPRSRPRVSLVGKGIIFDTGGNNLKPFKGMLNMHIDMQGSAVALATLQALTTLNADFGVDCWLAITENRIGAKAYKSQDVITALNGSTIQTIHTDAEGRMALADTLTLAARRKPDLMIDFATLTGACVTATTTRYSGVFTNRPQWHQMLIDIGQRSGERVWPFPIDDEFSEDLSSATADLVQCTIDGSGDHIMAARFLRHFVPEGIPWLHMDLSAAERSGGLGLVPTELTGFGTRFTLTALEALTDLLKSAKHD